MDVENNSVTITAEEASNMRKECEYWISLYEPLMRLLNNSDFKKVYLEEYETNQAARLVSCLGDHSFNLSDKKEYHRKELEERMIGIARFSEYNRTIIAKAEQAKQTLSDLANATIMK